MYNPIFIFLIFSGFTSMIYQIVWLRLFSLSVGATNISISIVVGSFFLGMGIGSLLAQYIKEKKSYTIFPYVVLEGLIGSCGILSLPILLHLDWLVTHFGSFLDSEMWKFLLVFILILTPTVAMGATLPVVSALLIRHAGYEGNIYAGIYSFNTFGAVLGALLGGFLIIPYVGLDGAIYIASGINLFTALLAYIFYKDKSFHTSKREKSQYPIPLQTNPKLRKKALAILFVTGFVSIATEIGWTKFLIIFTGSTMYGFSILLTILLFGIATGAWIIRKYINKIENKTVWLSYSLATLGVSLIFTYSGLSYVAPVYAYLNSTSMGTVLQNSIKYLIIFILLFPPSFLFGIIFPQSISLYVQNTQNVLKGSSIAFGVNTIAGVLASLVAGFWIIPFYGTATLLVLMSLLVIIAVSIFFDDIARNQHRMRLIFLTSFSLMMLFMFPKLDFQPLIATTYNHTMRLSKVNPNIIYLKEGKSSVIALVENNGRYIRVLNNGLSESSIDIFDDDDVNLAESFLALIPYFFHKDPKDTFIVGFGGGTSVYAMTRTKVSSIDIVELEPLIIEALKTVYKDGIPALRDKRVHLNMNDARYWLLKNPKKYDIIISQPSHPWLNGASALFTQEFFHITRSRLKKNGIYGQWVNLFNMDVTTLKSIIKAFNNVYPYSLSFVVMGTEDFLLFGSKQPFDFDLSRLKERMEEPSIMAILQNYGIHRPEDLLRYRAFSRSKMQEMTKDSAVNSDTNIISEVRLSKLNWRRPKNKKEDPYRLFFPSKEPN